MDGLWIEDRQFRLPIVIRQGVTPTATAPKRRGENMVVVGKDFTFLLIVV